MTNHWDYLRVKCKYLLVDDRKNMLFKKKKRMPAFSWFTTNMGHNFIKKRLQIEKGQRKSTCLGKSLKNCKSFHMELPSPNFLVRESDIWIISTTTITSLSEQRWSFTRVSNEDRLTEWKNQVREAIKQNKTQHKSRSF